MNNPWPQAGLVGDSSPSYHVQDQRYFPGQVPCENVHGLDNENAGHFPAHVLYSSTSQSYGLSQYTLQTVEKTPPVMRNGNPYSCFDATQPAASSAINGVATGPLVDRRNSQDALYNDAFSASYPTMGYPMSDYPISSSKVNHISVQQTSHVYAEYSNSPVDNWKKDASFHAQLGPQRSRHSSVNTSPYSTTSPRRQTYKEIVIPLARQFDDSHSSGPTNYRLVRQEEYCDDQEQFRGQGLRAHRDRPIIFQKEGFPEKGVILSDVFGPASRMAGAHDKVFKGLVFKEIKLKLHWPGCRFQFEKRIKTQNGETDRHTLLVNIWNLIREYMEKVKRRGYDRGLDDCPLREDVLDKLIVTRLIHRGGSNWQPEIWYPNYP